MDDLKHQSVSPVILCTYPSAFPKPLHFPNNHIVFDFVHQFRGSKTRAKRIECPTCTRDRHDAALLEGEIFVVTCRTVGRRIIDIDCQGGRRLLVYYEQIIWYKTNAQAMYDNPLTHVKMKIFFDFASISIQIKKNWTTAFSMRLVKSLEKLLPLLSQTRMF